MQFAFTCSLLMLGSGILTFRILPRGEEFKQHLGMMLMLYGFLNLLGFGLEFLRGLGSDPVFVISKMTVILQIIVIGFVLAYPFLQKHLFEESELQKEGAVVFQGFAEIRTLLGLSGLVLAGIMLFWQFF
jgi:hypothetical protein